MATVKYSRQREAIKNFLMSRKDHPTAEVVYEHVLKAFPNISLGTVYRNLNLLADQGKLLRIRVPNGSDRFDGWTEGHTHILCTHCGQVFDIPFQDLPGLEKQIHGIPDFTVTGYQLLVEGVCGNCMDNQDKKA